MNDRSDVIRFGDFELVPAERRLLRDGLSVEIAPKVFDTLLVLVQARGSAVSKRELTDAVWPDTFVVENSLTKNISALRRLLGDQAIETVSRFGYRLTLEIHDGDALVPAGAKRPSRHWLAAVVAVVAILVALAAGSGRYGPSGSERPRYVSVVPLRVLHASAEQRYLADAVPAAITARLALVPGIAVRADLTVPVDAVVRGTLETDEQIIRVFVEIVDSHRGVIEWSHSFSTGLSEVTLLQQSIAIGVSEHLSPGLTQKERAALTPPHSRDAVAMAEYLRGRDLLDRRVNLDEAITHLEAAVARDPNFGLGWAGLAEALAVPYRKGSSDDIERAVAAARRALALDPGLAEAHATLGYIALFHRWNWVEAERELREALRRNPNSARFHDWLAIALLPRGRTAEALTQVERAHALDPASVDIADDVILIHHLSRDYQGVERAARAMIAQQPIEGAGSARGYLIGALISSGRYDDALAEMTKHPTSDERPLFRAALRYRRGDRDERERALQQLRDPQRAPRNINPDEVARIYLLLGEKQEAIRWLERAYAEHTFALIFAGVDPGWDDLRGDAQFEQFLQRLGVVSVAPPARS